MDSLCAKLRERIRASVHADPIRTPHRPGTECLANALKSIAEADPMATLMPVDGVGAADSARERAREQHKTKKTTKQNKKGTPDGMVLKVAPHVHPTCIQSCLSREGRKASTAMSSDVSAYFRIVQSILWQVGPTYCGTKSGTVEPCCSCTASRRTCSGQPRNYFAESNSDRAPYPMLDRFCLGDSCIVIIKGTVADVVRGKLESR